jgi:hypothetical protein
MLKKTLIIVDIWDLGKLRVFSVARCWLYKIVNVNGPFIILLSVF